MVVAVKTIYALIVFLQILVVIYIVASWLFKKSKFVEYLYSLLLPFVGPIEYLMKKSTLDTSMIDFAPIILLLMLTYLGDIFY